MPRTLAALRGVAQPQPAPDRTEPGTSGRQSVAHQWLRSVFSHDRAPVITRKPGEGWVSVPAAWSLEYIAKAVCGRSQVVGLRPEGKIRVGMVDIDHKPEKGVVSPYWHPYGQSRQLQGLEREALAAGCSYSLIRSSASGGLHCFIQFPEALPAWKAHWVLAELVARAGMKLAAGSCELFPSQLAYSESTNPADWAQSHGYRLPGQDGSALLIGDHCEHDANSIYSHLLQALAYTEALPSWDALLEASTARCKESKTSKRKILPRALRRATSRRHGVVWTGPGQSNENLKLITRWARAAHPQALSVPRLARVIKTAALAAPGFHQHASAESKRDLAGDWAERWARSSLSKSWNAPEPKAVDRHHNRGLWLQSRAALTRLWKSLKGAAAELSQRAVAEQAGLNRKNVRRHWDYWLQLLSGPHPLNNGGAAPSLPFSSFDLAVPIPPPSSAESIAPAVPLPPEPEPPPDPPDCSARVVLPFRPDARPADEWRARERDELAAWLAAAA